MKTKKSRALLFAAAATMAFGIQQAAAAIVLNTSSPYYLGYATPGLPAGEADEVAFINNLIGLAPGGNGLVVLGPHNNTTNRSTNVFASLPTATTVGGVKDESPANPFDFGGGYAYIIAKYGAGGGFQRIEVWYTGGLSGEFEIEPTQALSHVGFYNPGRETVPDGAGTVALLGLALMGLGGARRFLGKRA